MAVLATPAFRPEASADPPAVLPARFTAVPGQTRRSHGMDFHGLSSDQADGGPVLY